MHFAIIALQFLHLSFPFLWLALFTYLFNFEVTTYLVKIIIINYIVVKSHFMFNLVYL